jgi:TRAP-type C4-dicarboxylate transport system permease small subunit
MSRLLRGLEWAAGALLGLISLLVVYQVAMRYLAGSPPSWTEELARYLQVWLVLLAAPVCLARNMHLALDFLPSKLKGGLGRLARRAILLLVGAFSLVLTAYGVKLLKIAALQSSPALGLSMVWPYLALPVSGGLMMAVVVWKLGDRSEGEARPSEPAL